MKRRRYVAPCIHMGRFSVLNGLQPAAELSLSLEKQKMHNIKVITSTTREGSKGIAIANWITDFAKESGLFDIELLDLARINLPFMNEPQHPRMQQYKYQHTKDWSRVINEADGFIIVLGEYNFGFPAPVKNAIDYLFNEWKYKAVAFVSYGGASGGLRSTQMLKQVVTSVYMTAVVDQVQIAFFAKMIGEDHVFRPTDSINKAATAMLNELSRWAGVLKPLRAN